MRKGKYENNKTTKQNEKQTKRKENEKDKEKEKEKMKVWNIKKNMRKWKNGEEK